jgi:transposase InsO family protein
LASHHQLVTTVVLLGVVPELTEHPGAEDDKTIILRRGENLHLLKPHCPWQNGKLERYNRTLRVEWAYRQVFTTNDARCAAHAPWLDHSIINDTTQLSEASPRSADCHQPLSRVVARDAGCRVGKSSSEALR